MLCHHSRSLCLEQADRHIAYAHKYMMLLICIMLPLVHHLCLPHTLTQQPLRGLPQVELLW